MTSYKKKDAFLFNIVTSFSMILVKITERMRFNISNVLQDSEDVYLRIAASILSLSLVANDSKRTPFL